MNDISVVIIIINDKHTTRTLYDTGYPHCHLKLSKLKGKTLSGQGFLSWMLSMMAKDYRTTDFDAVTTAVGEAIDQEVCGFGDILTPGDTAISDILTKMGVYHTCFCEAFGFSPMDPEADAIPYKKTRTSAIAGAGHALYTTGADILQTIKTHRKSS